jgi:hypothetical protein
VLHGDGHDDRLDGGPGEDRGRGGGDVNGDRCTGIETAFGCEWDSTGS